MNGRVALTWRFKVVDVVTSRTVVFLVLMFSGLPEDGSSSKCNPILEGGVPSGYNTFNLKGSSIRATIQYEI